MRQILILTGMLILFGCGTDNSQATIYLSNHSLNEFDRSLFKVFVNERLIINDSIFNKYLSFQWKDSVVSVPKGDFRLRIIVNSNGYELLKDTLVSGSDSLKVFVTFGFTPYLKRYRNPELLQYLPNGSARLKKIADSLYARGTLSNADEYLNDSIPMPKDIEILIK
jgi:hypothetical protein